MKKIIQAISVVLAMLLLVSAISVAPFATTDPAIVVNGADTAEPGATVELTVDAQNFEGANIFGMQFDIDLGGLTDVEITAGALLEGIAFEGNMVEGVYKVAEINNVSEDDVATYFGNGTIFTISGKVSETVADTHTVEVKDIICCDFENVEEIAVTGGSKTVTVEEAEVAGPTPVTLKFQHTLSLKSNIRIAIVPTLTDEFKGCAEVYAISTQMKLDDNDVPYIHTSEKIYPAANGYFYYGDMLAYEMTHKVSTTIYGCDAEGNVLYKSNVDEYGVLDYVSNQFAKSTTAADLKTVLADLVNYGAAAQIYSAYEVDQLVNAVGDYTAPNGTVVNIANEVSTNATKNDPELANIENKNGTDGTAHLSNLLSLKSAVELMYAIPKNAVDKYGKENVELRIHYYGKDYPISGAEFTSYNSSYYGYYFNEIIAADFGEIITAAVYAGGEQITSTRTYSIEAYCYSKVNDANSSKELVDVCNAIMKYGKAVNAYFS